ncbi:hypothetical protein BSLG_002315 [Batrachochytrium salamandrivorans]|nr:hypothetical protein BSLG_002315 [Batrachochytrium salamandrivorans]
MSYTTSGQMYAMIKMRRTLVRREIRTLLAGLLLPIILVGVAVGISAGIQSSIPTAPAIPPYTRPMATPAALQTVSSIALVLPRASPAQQLAVTNSMQRSFALLNRTNITLVPFASIDDYQTSLVNWYRGAANATLIPAAFAVLKDIPTSPSADGLLDIQYQVLLEESQPKDLNPVMLLVADNAKQSLLQQTGYVSFNVGLSFFAFEGFFYDVSLTIIPAFVVNAFAQMIVFFAISKVEERESKKRDYLFTMGLAPSVYYLSAFVVDAYAYLLNLLVSSLILLAFKVKAFSDTNYLNWFLPMFCFGAVCIPLSSCLSFMFRQQASAGAALGFGMSIVVFVPYFLVFFVAKNNLDQWIMYLISAIVPTFGFYSALSAIGTASNAGTPYTLASLGDFTNNPILPISLILLAQAIVYCLILTTLVYKDLTNAPSFTSSAVNLFRHLVHGEKSTPSNTDSARDSTSHNLMEGVQNAQEPKDDELTREMQRISNPDLAAEDVIRMAGVHVEFSKPASRSIAKKWYMPSAKEKLVVLDDLWLSIRKNECFAYLGPNGCGKTTTLNTLIGLVRPTRGMATIGQYSVLPRYNPLARQIIGICPQFDCQWQKLSPREHLITMAAIRGLNPEDATVISEIDTLIADVGLSEFSSKHTGTLSGGNKRKLSLAMACIGRPEVIFLDEPTTGVDVSIRKSIWEIIKQLKTRTSVILTTHSMEEAEALSDRIGIIVNGRMQCIGSAQRLKTVYGRGYKVTIKASGAVDEVREWFLNAMGEAGTWEVSRQVGATIVFQMTRKGVAQLHHRFSTAHSDKEKAVMGMAQLEHIFRVLESPVATAGNGLNNRFGIVSHEVRETSMTEVFVAFASLQKGLEQ